MADCTPPGAVAPPPMAGFMNSPRQSSREASTALSGTRQTKSEPVETHLQLYDIAPFSDPHPSVESHYSHVQHTSPSPSSVPRSRNGSQATTLSSASTSITPKPLTFKEFVSPAAARKSKHERHSRQEWESRKDAIHKLYIEEGRPLRDVMKIMETRGFKATTKMYKLRLAEWEFNKNNRERDIAAMLQVQGQRSAEGKTTTFRRHGKPVQIEAYLRRKGIDALNLPTTMLEDQRELPTYIRQLTPPPSVSLSGQAQVQELLFHCFRDLAWKRQATAGNDLSWVIEKGRYVGTPTMNALRDMYDADCLFVLGLPKLGGAVCERSFRSIHHLVLDPTLDGFSHLITNLQRMRSPGIGKETWKYLSGYARAIQANGPIKALLGSVEKLFDGDQIALDERQEFLTDCIDKLLVSDEKELGFPATTITQLYPFLFQIPMLNGTVDPRYQRLQRRCDPQKLEHLRGMHRERSLTPEPHAHSPIKSEDMAFSLAMMQRLQAEEEAFFESLQLLMVGDQSQWLSPEVTKLCASILARASDPQFEGGYYAYNAYKALALVNRTLWEQEKDQGRIIDLMAAPPESVASLSSPCSPVSNSTASAASPTYQPLTPQPNSSKLELAISYLEQAVGILERWTESEALLLEDLGRLEEWCKESGDYARAAALSGMRDDCISNLLEKSLSLNL